MTDQCRLALRTILDALPATGRLNARDVRWLRAVALVGLGEHPLGATLETTETAQLRAELAELRAVVREFRHVCRDAAWMQDERGGDDAGARLIVTGRATYMHDRFLATYRALVAAAEEAPDV